MLIDLSLSDVLGLLTEHVLHQTLVVLELIVAVDVARVNLVVTSRIGAWPALCEVWPVVTNLPFGLHSVLYLCVLILSS